jgi:hypothetical protein
MKIDFASIELRRLRDDELKLCVALLRTSLDNKKEMNALICDIEKFVFHTIAFGGMDEFLRNELAEAFTEPLARKIWRQNVRMELWKIQSDWRGSANGPDLYIAPKNNSKDNDFDSWSLSNTVISLPPLIMRKRSIGDHRPEPSNSRKKRRRVYFPRKQIRKPYLEISISSATELFHVLHVRAVSNGQLSRFVRCIVCGNWELKARSGRRSQAKINYMEEHLDNQKWGKFWRRLPHWPGICTESACRDRFTNVALGRSPFREEDFPGLQRKGLTQHYPGLRKID